MRVQTLIIFKYKARDVGDKMVELAQYYVDFLRDFFLNVWIFFTTLFSAFANIFTKDIPGYFRSLSATVIEFNWLAWIVYIIITLVNICLVFFIFYRLYQIIRRYVIFRSKQVDKDVLLEQIAILKKQAEELNKEKSKIFAIKVNADLSNLEETEHDATAVGTATSDTGETPSRFVKLIDIDKRYERNPSFVYMQEEDKITLKEYVDRFVNFSASQLNLYYNHKTIRQFFAGLATSKIIILEGISGTGKTSLPYAMGKFFNNNAAIVSVQPSWRDRAELLGYLNEFTKKFNETDFLSSLYEVTHREDPNFIVLDEMNLARIEYYFAEFLSIMEMPDKAEWKIDIVPNPLDTDPINMSYGKLLVPQNVWFIGTANNDDSTFTITDKVYDRAVALELNAKADYFDAPLTPGVECNYNYLEGLFEAALTNYPMSTDLMDKVKKLDLFIQDKFKIAFGNRIVKQIKLFVPNYIACGGTELEGLDFMLTTKLLKKFNSLNLPFLSKELKELSALLDKMFGKGVMVMCLDYIEQLEKKV